MYFASSLYVIFGQNHLIFGQALNKIFGQETSAPPPPPPKKTETGPVRLDDFPDNSPHVIF